MFFRFGLARGGSWKAGDGIAYTGSARVILSLLPVEALFEKISLAIRGRYGSTSVTKSNCSNDLPIESSVPFGTHVEFVV